MASCTFFGHRDCPSDIRNRQRGKEKSFAILLEGNDLLFCYSTNPAAKMGSPTGCPNRNIISRSKFAVNKNLPKSSVFSMFHESELTFLVNFPS